MYIYTFIHEYVADVHVGEYVFCSVAHTHTLSHTHIHTYTQTHMVNFGICVDSLWRVADYDLYRT